MDDRGHAVLPTEGRRRVVIEDVEPKVDCGRFPVKHILGDIVTVTAAIYGDGHDHVAARVLYKREDQIEWRSIKMEFLGNDLWHGSFIVDEIGLWQFRVEGWIDHFDTWADDFAKRLTVQADASLPTDNSVLATSGEMKKEIPLALLSGAELLYRISIETGGPDLCSLQEFARSFVQLAERKRSHYDNPVTKELREVVARHPDLRFATQSPDFSVRVDRQRARFSTWYEFFPRSHGANGEHGTFADAAKLFPELSDAGFDVIYFPPIHPIGKAYRKGKNNSVTAEADAVGSPWAIGNHQGGHTAIAPELGGFIEFDSLLRTAKLCGIEVALDIAFQCSPDHPWVKSHPDWFLIRPDGSIQYAENPPKKYQDIYPLNFESNDWRSLWEELSNVFLFWIKRGVKIFRVDNPHTKALPFWEWCISKIQRSHPDVIFLSEAFTRPYLMYGLAKRGFTQSYTYFSWRNTKDEITTYLTEINSDPVRRFFRPNFWPNTPDILPVLLQRGRRASFIQRAVLAATLAANYGIYGPAYELMEGRPFREGGEEYAESEKYQLRQWDRSRSDSLMPLIKTLNKARHQHPCLQQDNTLHFHQTDNPMLICYSKRAGRDLILVVVSLDTDNVQSGWCELDLSILGLKSEQSFECRDLLGGQTYVWTGSRNYILLDPNHLPAHVFHVPFSDLKDQKELA
jgi:starch synthase (maltosyl-transferring)